MNRMPSVLAAGERKAVALQVVEGMQLDHLTPEYQAYRTINEQNIKKAGSKNLVIDFEKDFNWATVGCAGAFIKLERISGLVGTDAAGVDHFRRAARFCADLQARDAAHKNKNRHFTLVNAMEDYFLRVVIGEDHEVVRERSLADPDNVPLPELNEDIEYFSVRRLAPYWKFFSLAAHAESEAAGRDEFAHFNAV